MRSKNGSNRHGAKNAKIRLACVILLLLDLTAEAQTAFPHHMGKHNKIACTSCHVLLGPAFNVTSLPNHAVCASCHNFADEAVDHFKTFCGICHKSELISADQPALFALSERKGPSEFEKLFLHSPHLKPSNQKFPECFDCHTKAAATRSGTAQIPTASGHKACFGCHTHKSNPAPPRQQCNGCHSIGSISLTHTAASIKGFTHADHEFDTRPVKKKELFARRADYLCAECHQPLLSAKKWQDRSWQNSRYCEQCHNGIPGLPQKLGDVDGLPTTP